MRHQRVAPWLTFVLTLIFAQGTRLPATVSKPPSAPHKHVLFCISAKSTQRSVAQGGHGKFDCKESVRVCAPMFNQDGGGCKRALFFQ